MMFSPPVRSSYGRSLPAVVACRLSAALLFALHLRALTVEAAAIAPRLYWANGIGDLFSAGLDGSSPRVIRRDLGVNSLAVAPSASDLFAASPSEGGILRLDGSASTQALVTPTASNVSAMAFDATNQHIYWAEHADNLLWRSDLQGDNKELLAVGVSQITAIQVDPVGGHYYWSSGASGSIVRADIDTGSHDIINYARELGSSWITDLTVDIAGQRLFTVDASLNAIVNVGGDGSGPEILTYQGVAAPKSIAYDSGDGRVYWSNSTRVIAGMADYVATLPPDLQRLIPEYSYIPSEYDYYVMSAKSDGSDLRKEFQPRLIFADSPIGSVAAPRNLAVAYVTVPEPNIVTALYLGFIPLLLARDR